LTEVDPAKTKLNFASFDANARRINRYNNLMLDQEMLDELIQRVVEAAQPSKLIVFGSQARGAGKRDSDIDLLVITQGPVHRGRLTEEIYMKLIGVGRAIDVIVITPDDVKKHKDNPYLVISPALREGIVVYEKEASVVK
jgi:uncharacterized protein